MPDLLEDRYAYYRRCQELRRNGEQCKAPAERGSEICHAHAAQLAAVAKLKAERCAVLERAAVETVLKGTPSIPATIAATAQALINGTISEKAAGRLLMDMQQIIGLL